MQGKILCTADAAASGPTLLYIYSHGEFTKSCKCMQTLWSKLGYLAAGAFFAVDALNTHNLI